MGRQDGIQVLHLLTYPRICYEFPILYIYIISIKNDFCYFSCDVVPARFDNFISEKTKEIHPFTQYVCSLVNSYFREAKLVDPIDSELTKLLTEIKHSHHYFGKNLHENEKTYRLLSV